VQLLRDYYQLQRDANASGSQNGGALAALPTLPALPALGSSPSLVDFPAPALITGPDSTGNDAANTGDDATNITGNAGGDAGGDGDGCWDMKIDMAVMGKGISGTWQALMSLA
jgi:hypothetical protein